MGTEVKMELERMAIQMLVHINSSTMTGADLRENVKKNYELLERLIEGEK